MVLAVAVVVVVVDVFVVGPTLHILAYCHTRTRLHKIARGDEKAQGQGIPRHVHTTVGTSWASQVDARAVDWPCPAHYYILGRDFFTRC